MSLPPTIPPLLQRLELTTSQPDRLSLLQTISRELLPHSPTESLRFLLQGLQLAEELKRTYEQAWFHKKIGWCKKQLGQIGEAFASLKTARNLFRKIEDKEEEATTAVELGRVAAQAGRYEKSAEVYREAQELFLSLNDESGQLAALKGLGDLYDQLGDHHNALYYFHCGLQVARGLESCRDKGIAFSDVGILCAKLGEHQRALEYLQESWQQFRLCDAHDLEVRSLSNISSVYAGQGKVKDALEFGLRGLAVCEAVHDKEGLAVLLMNLSNIYERDGHPETAINMRMKALTLFEQLEDLHGESVALFGLGNLYRKTGRLQNAVHLLEHALDIVREANNIELELQCREVLSEAFEEIGDLQSALTNVRTCLALREKNEQAKRRKEIDAMQARFDMERAEKEREIYRLRNEQLEAENQHRTAEVAALSMHLLEKSQLIRDVRSEIEKISEDGAGNEGSRVRDIAQTIKRNANTGQDWERFKEAIDLVHQDFIRTLIAEFPLLTPAELRICALVRLGLSSAEIADILHVTKRNVDTHRYRLRKKLNLKGRASLVSFLSNVGVKRAE